MKHPVYMDHNATTAVLPAVQKAVARALELTGNASSVHGAGRAARKVIEDARDRVAALVGAKSADVVFTSGGTETNNLAIRGLQQDLGQARVLASAVEHTSVLKAASNIETIAVDSEGVVDLEALDTMLAGASSANEAGPALVSVMLANNETGVIQPVAGVAAVAKRHGALVHCDAVQAAGKISIDIAALGVHMMSLSAHKIGGPAGVGALVLAGDLAHGANLFPIVLGGGQERGRRAGSENLTGIAGFGVAAEEALKNLPEFPNLAVWRNRLEDETSCRLHFFCCGLSALKDIDPGGEKGVNVLVRRRPTKTNADGGVGFVNSHAHGGQYVARLDLARRTRRPGTEFYTGQIESDNLAFRHDAWHGQAAGISQPWSAGAKHMYTLTAAEFIFQSVAPNG